MGYEKFADIRVKEEDLLRELITINGTKINNAEIAKLVKRLKLDETISLSQFVTLDSKFLHRNLSLLIIKINNYLLSNVIKPEKISCSKNPPLSAYEDSSFTNEFKPNLKDPIFILE